MRRIAGRSQRHRAGSSTRRRPGGGSHCDGRIPDSDPVMTPIHPVGGGESQSVEEEFHRKLPAVRDNAGNNTSRLAERAPPSPAGSGICLYFLPPYSPELNRVGPVFRQVNHQHVLRRSDTTRKELRDAVALGFSNHGRGLRSIRQKEPRPAAWM